MLTVIGLKRWLFKMKKLPFIIFSLISGYLLLLALFLETAFSPLPFGALALLAFVFAGLACGKLFLQSGNKKLRFFSPFSYAFAWLAVFVLISGFMVMTIQNYVAFKRAENLISQVDAYYHQHGSYPAALEEISKAEGASVSSTFPALSHRPFGYNWMKEGLGKQSKEHYQLAFESYFGTAYVFDSKSDTWSNVASIRELAHENIFALKPSAFPSLLGIGFLGRKANNN